MNRLTRFLFGDPDSHRDEAELREKVAAEKAVLFERKRRAERVLADFHRADTVIRGDVRGNR